MADIVKWGDISFYVKANAIRGVKDISISASCETEDSTVDGEKFVKRKNGKPYEIAMTAVLDARLGESVQSTALKLTEAARCSSKGYFYTGSAKLLPSQFMMISAKIDKIEHLPNGTWIYCEVALTLKQCTKANGSTKSESSSSSSGSKKSSTKSTSTKKTTSSTKKKSTISAVVGAVAGAVASVAKGVASFVSAAKKQSAAITAKATAAKKKNTAKKTTTTKRGFFKQLVK